MISVLIPVDDVYRATDTVYNLQEHCVAIEVILSFKRNDVEALSRLDKLPLVRHIITEDFGTNYHEYINAMCMVANGDILMPMHEDTKVFTKGWDFFSTGDISVVHLGQVGTCPGITRKLYSILGHFSLHPEYVSYITGVGQLAGINTVVPVKCSARRHGLSDQDEYTFTGRGIQTLMGLDSANIKRAIGDKK